jgi:hypothetical protein
VLGRDKQTAKYEQTMNKVDEKQIIYANKYSFMYYYKFVCVLYDKINYKNIIFINRNL